MLMQVFLCCGNEWPKPFVASISKDRRSTPSSASATSGGQRRPNGSEAAGEVVGGKWWVGWGFYDVLCGVVGMNLGVLLWFCREKLRGTTVCVSISLVWETMDRFNDTNEDPRKLANRSNFNIRILALPTFHQRNQLKSANGNGSKIPQYPTKNVLALGKRKTWRPQTCFLLGIFFLTHGQGTKSLP